MIEARYATDLLDPKTGNAPCGYKRLRETDDRDTA